jgi:hypothetical protein
VGLCLAVENCNLRVEGNVLRVWFIEKSGDNFLGAVADDLKVECAEVVLVKFWFLNLSKRNPVEGQVLVLGALHFVREDNVEGLHLEIGQRCKHHQVGVAQYFHHHRELIINNLVKNFSNFSVGIDV